MRRISTASAAAALALSLTLGFGTGPAQAAAGYDSAYQFESAFLTLAPGDNGTFAAFFANTGTTSWVKNSGSQVNLGICDSSKVFCNVNSPNAAFAASWLSPIAYATHTKEIVVPGDFSPFSYAVKVPIGQAAGLYRFNGDLVLATTGERIHPEGYYQDVLVAAPTVSLGVTPAYEANEDNEASTTVPGNGQHTYTFNTTFTGTLSFAVLPSSNIQRNSDSTYSFCDASQDKKADGVGAGGTLFTGVNGVSIPQSTVLLNQTIPANGQITVTIDSATRNERVRVIAWQDKNQNGQLDLTATGPDTTCNTLEPYDATTDGAIVVSGRKYYFGPKAQFGSQFPECTSSTPGAPVYRHDSTNQVFSAGDTSDTSLRFTYDSNDIFKLTGVQVSMSVFQAGLNPQADGSGSRIHVNYDPNPSGFSTFDICNTSGANAPNNLSAATGNFDSGSTADDVRLTFTAPANNQITSYSIQRAFLGSSTTATPTNCTLGTTAPSGDTSATPASSTFTTFGSVTVTAGQQGTFTNFDLSNGGYCYRVMVQNPTTGQQSFSNYVPVNPGSTSPDTQPPASTSSVLTVSSGLSNTLDAGDKIVIDFADTSQTGCTTTTCGMSIAGNAVIRVTDSDCGPATESGPASCGTGSGTNTVADIVCGTNATCVSSTPTGTQTNSRLTITMTTFPTIVSAGSTAQASYPVVVTDSSGITDLSGNAWNLTPSSGTHDRVFGPFGN